jgi:hypothetical protein
MSQQYQMTNSRSADKFVVRLPNGMRDRISEVAGENHRSMNSEIIARIERTLAYEGRAGTHVNAAELSAGERELIARFRDLTHRHRNALLALIELDPVMGREAA